MELARVLDLWDERSLRAIGLSTNDLVLPDRTLTQSLGEAAHERGYQAIRSPSATGVADVLALLADNLGQVVTEVDLVEHWRTVDDLG